MRHGSQPLAWTVLQYVLAHEAVSTVIPGAKSVRQVRENLSAADGSLASEVVAAMHAWWERELAHDPLSW
jgi:aryl-alcohol dehydrogenase-like predicted oxidoreductase